MEENKATSGEDVNGQQANPNAIENEGNKEQSQEKDYKTMYENMQKALREEREARKEKDAKLTEFEKREQAEIEKKMKEKGKFEELLQEKDKKLSDYEKQLQELAGYKTKYVESKTKEIDTYKSKIPEGKKDFVEKLLNGKELDEQIEILGEFSKQFAEYDPNPKGDSSNPKQGSEYDKAKASGKTSDMFNALAKELFT